MRLIVLCHNAKQNSSNFHNFNMASSAAVVVVSDDTGDASFRASVWKKNTKDTLKVTSMGFGSCSTKSRHSIRRMCRKFAKFKTFRRSLPHLHEVYFACIAKHIDRCEATYKRNIPRILCTCEGFFGASHVYVLTNT